MTTYPQIVLDEALEHDMFVVALSKEPNRQFEALSLEKQLLIKELVLKYCPSKFAEDFFTGVLHVCETAQFEWVHAMVYSCYRFYKDDIYQDCLAKLHSLLTPNKRTGNISYNPEKGSFKNYAFPILRGEAYNSFCIYDNPTTTNVNALKMAKRLRKTISEHFGQETPDYDEIARVCYNVDSSSPRYRLLVESIAYYLSIYNNPVSLYKRMNNDDGDYLIDFIESKEPNAEENILNEEIKEVVRVVLRTLDEDTLKVYLKYRLRYKTHEYTSTQAAKDLGMSRAGFFNVLKRADNTFREAIKEYYNL